MSSLSNVESRLPPGFRFHPRDEELVCEYLMNQVIGSPNPFPSLIQVDLNNCEPWQIPESACVGGKEWYFYSQKDRKYATGSRTNRATLSGYWKATGKDRPILHNGTLVGMRKTLVFYEGRAPKGRKTDWVMHEFRLEGPNSKVAASSIKGDWVLCRVSLKNKRGMIREEEGEGKEDEMTSSSTAAYVAYDYNECDVSCFSNFTNPSLFQEGSRMFGGDTLLPDISGGYGDSYLWNQYS